MSSHVAQVYRLMVFKGPTHDHVYIYVLLLIYLPDHIASLGSVCCNLLFQPLLHPAPLYIHCFLYAPQTWIIADDGISQCQWCRFVYFWSYCYFLDSFYFLAVLPLQQPWHLLYSWGYSRFSSSHNSSCFFIAMPLQRPAAARVSFHTVLVSSNRYISMC